MAEKLMKEPLSEIDKPYVILIAEDSPTQAAEVRYVLEKAEYKVTLVANGKIAWEWLNTHTPDIVISDVIMPEMDGYELCRLIREDERLQNIPVILLTHLSEPADVLKGLECGANNFILKPFDKKFLLGRIKSLLAPSPFEETRISENTIELRIGEHTYMLQIGRTQILDLLLSLYENASQKAIELEKANRELEKTLAQIKKLQGLIPICSYCKKIRHDRFFWEQVETYIEKHSEAQFTHSICPDCYEKYLKPEIDALEKQNKKSEKN